MKLEGNLVITDPCYFEYLGTDKDGICESTGEGDGTYSVYVIKGKVPLSELNRYAENGEIHGEFLGKYSADSGRSIITKSEFVKNSDVEPGEGCMVEIDDFLGSGEVFATRDESGMLHFIGSSDNKSFYTI